MTSTSTTFLHLRKYKLFQIVLEITWLYLNLPFIPRNPDYYEEIRLGDTQSLTNWDISSKTKILVHGWGQNVNATFPQNVKNGTQKLITYQ